MSRAGVFFFLAAIAAAVATLRVQAQSPLPPYLVQENIGLPAVDEGALLSDETHTPKSAEALRRAGMRAMLHGDAIGSSGVPYKRGRLLVKFKDGVSQAAQAAAIASASRTGAKSQRPSYANFDIVNMDANEDAEATARALSQRPEVEYAQPEYRVRALFVPNDPFYKSSP